MQTRLAELKSALAERGMLYAILDACDAPLVPERLRGLAETKARSLFKGSVNESLSGIAPYLVEVTPEMLAWITTQMWREPWGIFAVPRVEFAGDLDALWSHFRKLLMVHSDGQWLYFRFYDPRVLPNFLHSCGPEQAADVLGPCSMLGVATSAEQAQVLWLLIDEGAARLSWRPKGALDLL
jgi:hypothetical protein